MAITCRTKICLINSLKCLKNVCIMFILLPDLSSFSSPPNHWPPSRKDHTPFSIWAAEIGLDELI